MGHFSDYCKYKESLEITVGQKEQESRRLLDILKMASVNHRNDVMTFLSNLGLKDHRIRAALDEYSKNKLNQFNQEERPDNKDVIVPNSGDSPMNNSA